MKSHRAPIVVTALLLSGCASLAHVAPAPPTGGAESLVQRHAATGDETVLYDFKSPGYGIDYVSPLTPDGHGDYFGTTEVGGSGHGTIYELKPDGRGGFRETTLHAFTGYLDGGTPVFTPLIVDKDGDVFGITLDGGPNGHGVAYEMHRSGKSWVVRPLYYFGPAGAGPFSFIQDRNGNFFGTDNLYHDGGGITEGVFELFPSGQGWTAKIIFDDGIASATSGGGGLAMDAHGRIFGITSLAFAPSEIFELTRSGNAWTPKILYTFPRVDLYPEAPPVLDSRGNLYGTTVRGGPVDQGTVFALTPSRDGPWTKTTLYAFEHGSTYGEGPYSSITFDAAGDIYGSTAFGGPSDAGTIYELAPSGGRYVSKQVWNFDRDGGKRPFASVTLDTAGDVFGTTTQGGPKGPCYAGAGCGTAFEFKRGALGP